MSKNYENSTDREEWLQHSFTAYHRKVLAKEKESALNCLLSACRMSVDPVVIRAMAAYQGILGQEELFTKEVRDDESAE